MKDSDFLRRTMDHLGEPDQWCQGAMFTPHHGPGVGIDILEATEAFLLHNPQYISSSCLEGALSLTDSEVARLTLRLIGSETPWRQRVRAELKATLLEQYPDIVESFRKQAEKVQDELRIGNSIIGFGKSKSIGASASEKRLNRTVNHPEEMIEIPNFNDHEAMTYDGIRAVCEKTLTRLVEEGR